ncbi:MAG: RDD family protein [Candidatus Pristimantibacillus sp.]
MIESYNREATIVTSEHVKLQLRTAGVGSRAAAMLIDNILLLGAFCLVSLVMGLFLSISGIGMTDALGEYAIAFLILLAALLIGGYYALAEYYMAGQTYGKKWMGLRVVQENGQPITFLSAIIRNFFRIIDFLPSFYVIGAVWMFFHPRDKRLGDLAAGTMVVHDIRNDGQRIRKRTQKWLNNRKFVQPGPLSYVMPEYNTIQAKIGREDWLLLSGYVERLPSLDNRKRYELGWYIARRLGLKLELEGDGHLTDPESFLIMLYGQLYEEWSL